MTTLRPQRPQRRQRDNSRPWSAARHARAGTDIRSSAGRRHRGTHRVMDGPWASPDTAEAQLQRGRGAGALAALSAADGAGLVLSYVTHDWRWDHQTEERSSNLAQPSSSGPSVSTSRISLPPRATPRRSFNRAKTQRSTPRRSGAETPRGARDILRRLRRPTSPAQMTYTPPA
jgi:hypothetical protein